MADICEDNLCEADLCQVDLSQPPTREERIRALSIALVEVLEERGIYPDPGPPSKMTLVGDLIAELTHVRDYDTGMPKKDLDNISLLIEKIVLWTRQYYGPKSHQYRDANTMGEHFCYFANQIYELDDYPNYVELDRKNKEHDYLIDQFDIIVSTFRDFEPYQHEDPEAREALDAVIAQAFTEFDMELDF